MTLMLLLLLTLIAAQVTGECPVSREDFEENKPVEAVVGSDIILPCVSKFNVIDDILEWKKGKDDIYFVQDQERSSPHDDYKDRASVLIAEFKKNNASLKLSGVKETDKGEYCCCIVLDNKKKKCTTVTLDVNEKDNKHEDKQSYSGGNSILICSTQKITVWAGDDVILPCHLEPPISAESMRVEWTRPDPQPEYIHVHQDGRLLYEIQNPSYSFRTKLFVDQLINGNVSLKLLSVTPSDTGKYRCYLPSIQQEAVIQLSVGECPVSREDFEENTPVEAVVGSDVILPCVSKFNINVRDDILEWKKGKYDIYFVQDQERRSLGADYKDRASVLIKDLQKNNASLKLSGVKETDKGKYCCCIVLDNKKKKCSTVTLDVNEEDNKHEDKHEKNPGAETPSTNNTKYSGAVAGFVVVCLVVAVVGFV